MECLDDLPSPTGQPRAITGTLLYAPLSVLEGGPHTESSMLEGLFLSMLHIGCNGKLSHRNVYSSLSLSACANLRRGHLVRPALAEEPVVAPHLWPLVQRLHSLFYPFHVDLHMRSYRTDVRAADVQAACLAVGHIMQRNNNNAA